jgi:predicted RNase H-like HicB family nuclease
MTEQKLEIIVEQGADGGYSASAPLLPGCTAHGKTLEEALENMEHEIKTYVQNLMQEVMHNAQKQGLV